MMRITIAQVAGVDVRRALAPAAVAALRAALLRHHVLVLGPGCTGGERRAPPPPTPPPPPPPRAPHAAPSAHTRALPRSPGLTEGGGG